MFNFVLGLIVGGVGVWFVMRKQPLSNSPLARGESGSGNPNAEEVVRKRENLEKVMEMAAEKGEIKNDDVQYALGVSDATATRYLDELERQEKLTQTGSKKGAVYRIK